MFCPDRSPALKAVARGEGDKPPVEKTQNKISTGEAFTSKDGQVRKSAGEIEQRIVSTLSPQGPVALTKPTDRTTSRAKEGQLRTSDRQQQKTVQKPSQTTASAIVEPKVSGNCKEPEKAYSSRGREAQSWYQKAMKKMDESGNLRKDIKATVLEALENMSRLVRDAEQGKPYRDRKRMEMSEEIRKDGTKEEIEKVEKESMDREAIEGKDNMAELIKGHTKLLKENKVEMEKLKELLHRAHEKEKDREGEKEKSADMCTQLLKENKKEISKLKEEIERQYDERRTYAGVVAAPPGPKPMGGTTIHSVVVSSTDEMETGEQVLEKIRTAVNAREEGIQIENVRKAKDRKVIIGCGTKEEIGKVRDKLEKAGKNLNVEEVVNKNPLVILKEVLKINTNEDVIRGIRNQNGHLLEGLKGDENKVEVKFRKRARNSLTEHVVIGTSPEIWRRLTEAGAIHLDMQKIKVSDQSPLIQCARCLGYGHSKRFCRDPVDLCSHCGGPHLGTECVQRQSGHPPSCINCKNAKQERVNHNAFSEECPVRRRWDALARAAVQYC